MSFLISRSLFVFSINFAFLVSSCFGKKFLLNKFFIQNNADDLFHDKLSRSQNIDNLFLSDEEDKKTNFSKKNNLTIFEDKDLIDNQGRNLETDEDDDIINVPAFFRKKA